MNDNPDIMDEVVEPMNSRSWLALGAGTLVGMGAGMALSTFLPRKVGAALLDEPAASPADDLLRERTNEDAAWPDIGVTFLRCGSVSLPEFVAVRGAFSSAPRLLAHSAVLIHHPKGTFLYDTGLCTDIELFLMDQPWLFQQTLGKFTRERSLGAHLQQLHMQPKDLDFALISHLHWDHVAGIPDLPGVPLRVNELEFDAANQGLLDRNQGLVRRLLSDNPFTLFNLEGPPYEGFPCSHDLFGDGSIVLVPLPGHTLGQVGMFINRARGGRVFLIGDAAWFADNYFVPATMHPFFWSLVTSDDAAARQTLIELHRFARHHPEVPLIAMHDAQLQESFMQVERERHPVQA